MKLIIAGSRTLGVYNEFITGCFQSFNLSGYVDEIIAGGARGVDEAADHYAHTHGIGFKLFNADWDKYGKSAGPMRNREMAKYADALLLIWDGQSKGSASMLKEAKEYKLKIYEVILKKQN